MYFRIRKIIILKILTLLLLTFFTACSSKAQNSKEINDLQDLNLTGKVKLIRETNFQLVKDLGKITKIESDPLWEFNRLIYFDNKGKITEETFYSKSASSDTIWQKYNYQYGQNGKKIKADKFQKYGYPDSKFIITFEYNEIGQLIEQTEFDSKGKRTSHIEFKYLNNKLIEKIEYGSSNENIQNKTKFDYDENKNLVIKKILDKNGDLMILSEFDQGILAKEHNYGLKRDLSFDYKFDSQNNWIQKVISEKDKPVYLIEREIKYY
jgi:hypothetical protein